MFCELYPNVNETFLASSRWLRLFLRRNNIVFRRATSVGQKIPENAPEKCRDFLNDMMSLPVYEQFYNMDETPCYFDMPRSGTYDFRGIETVKLKTTGYEKLRFTTV